MNEKTDENGGLENARYFVRMAFNQLWRKRDLVYLDTNAWSFLAKGEAPVEPLAEWVDQNECFLWLARMQLAELSAKRHIIRGLADVLSRVGVVLIDRDQNEFSGEPWYKVKKALQQYLRLNTPELREAFVREFSGMHEAREKLTNDGKAFGDWIALAQLNAPTTEQPNWSTFPKRLENWIRRVCDQSGHVVSEEGLRDPNCYVGLRLSYGVLFQRYVVNRQSWQPSDYLDYLHAADMAYAKIVITERGLAEGLRQVTRRPDIVGPELIYDTSLILNLPRNALVSN